MIAQITTIEDIVTLAKSGFTDWKQYGCVGTRRLDDLVILNYTNEAQYKGEWNFFECVSRGLIIDSVTGEIVARPFDKFFNWGEGGRVSTAPIVSVTNKLDGCFRFDTPLQCWDGSTVLIGDVVNKKLTPTLIGMDKDGRLVPSKVIGHFNNGTKNDWIAITVSNPVSKRSGGRGCPNIVRVTPNHHIFLNGEFQPAQNAKPGDTVVNFNPALPKSSLHAIEAGLLGDGCITLGNGGYRYQENHKSAHKEYVTTIRQWFGDCCQMPRKTISGYGSEMWWVNTKKYTELADLREKWYPNNTKAIPKDLGWIDDFAVAKWYMDDGSLAHSPAQQDRALFATNGFNQQDVERLALRLEYMYGVDCTVYYAKGWSIRVNAGRNNSIATFWESIAPHIVSCMRYKLPEKYRSVEYTPYTSNNQDYVSVEATVLSVEPLEITERNFPSGRVGFDIKTETENYFAKGILVHNSLGILFRHNGKYRIATRGSFDSAQALWATQHWNEKYADVKVPDELTLMFEIIYPENRVVVDYKGKSGLYLIGARDRFTGRYVSYLGLSALAFTQDYLIATQPRIADMESMQAQLATMTNAEGFVVEFADGQRFKFKSAEYLRLHKLIFSLSFNGVLKAMQAGTLNEYIGAIPDEFLGDVKRWVGQIEATVAKVKADVEQAFVQAPKESRKEFALWGNKHHKALIPYLFGLLDGKDIVPMIYAKHEFKEA